MTGEGEGLPNGKIAFAALIGSGAAMHWPPSAVYACSFWEFFAASEGYRRANNPEEAPKPPTLEEHDALMAKHG